MYSYWDMASIFFKGVWESVLMMSEGTGQWNVFAWTPHKHREGTWPTGVTTVLKVYVSFLYYRVRKLVSAHLLIQACWICSRRGARCVLDEWRVELPAAGWRFWRTGCGFHSSDRGRWLGRCARAWYRPANTPAAHRARTQQETAQSGREKDANMPDNSRRTTK